MSKILLMTHGQMAQGMQDSIGLVFGQSDNLIVKSLNAGENIQDFRQSVKKIIEENTKDGILMLVDIFGGSPYNTAMYFYQQFKEKIDIKVVTGVNLPMLIEALASCDIMPLEELKDACISAGKDQILDSIKMFENSLEESNDDY